MNSVGTDSDDKKVTEHLKSTKIHMKWQWPENISELDLSHRQINDLEGTVALPPKLINLNLSHNNLSFVPAVVLKLSNIECLDLSHNNIKYFDDTPNFYKSIKDLDLSHNKLLRPPYWVWTESPNNLNKINLSCNFNLTLELTEEYFLELLQYKTLVETVIIFNCHMKNHLELLCSFPKVKALELGTSDLCRSWSNRISSIPCEGLDQCLDIERLNLSNTQLYCIENDIDIYKNLVEINLSQNNINGIPNKFCCLDNLEVCILSFNNILYLPDEMIKLKKLVCLKLDSNRLCMLPENLCGLPNLKRLDLYDNHLYEVVNDMTSLEELDLAMNYFEEPQHPNYMQQKERIRLNILDRMNGRKEEEPSPPESEHSPNATDDEELVEYMNNIPEAQPSTNESQERTSSPEDWDSDEYWVPRYYNSYKPTQSAWMYYIKHKMKQGNFCPMDLHPVSVSEQVRYEKNCYPKKWLVVEGQFDDLSSDES